MKIFYSLIILLMFVTMSAFSQQEINASSESLLTVLRVSNSLTSTAAAGKGAAISLGYPGGQYSTKIATIFEQSNPSYLNPALAFFTMHNSYLPGSEVERMRISSIGNVGIGTINPSSAQLQVAKSTGGTIAITTNGASATEANPATPSLDFLGYMDGMKARIRALERTYNGYGSSLIFSVKNDIDATTMTDVMTLKHNGNVGIGTTLPGEKLDIIDGKIRLTANQWGAGSFGQLQFFNGQGYSLTPRVYIEGRRSAGNDDGYLDLATSSGSNVPPSIRMTIDPAGNVGIGTLNTSDVNYKLFVETGIRTRKVKVDALAWADYVFDKDYKLPPLSEVDKYIQQNKHLPGVQSTADVEKNGIDLGENQATLLKKIEELTLYLIELNKKVESISNENELLKKLLKR